MAAVQDRQRRVGEVDESSRLSYQFSKARERRAVTPSLHLKFHLGLGSRLSAAQAASVSLGAGRVIRESKPRKCGVRCRLVSISRRQRRLSSAPPLQSGEGGKVCYHRCLDTIVVVSNDLVH